MSLYVVLFISRILVNRRFLVDYLFLYLIFFLFFPIIYLLFCALFSNIWGNTCADGHVETPLCCGRHVEQSRTGSFVSRACARWKFDAMGGRGGGAAKKGKEGVGRWRVRRGRGCWVRARSSCFLQSNPSPFICRSSFSLSPHCLDILSLRFCLSFVCHSLPSTFQSSFSPPLLPLTFLHPSYPSILSSPAFLSLRFSLSLTLLFFHSLPSSVPVSIPLPCILTYCWHFPSRRYQRFSH